MQPKEKNQVNCLQSILQPSQQYRYCIFGTTTELQYINNLIILSIKNIHTYFCNDPLKTLVITICNEGHVILTV